MKADLEINKIDLRRFKNLDKRLEAGLKKGLQESMEFVLVEAKSFGGANQLKIRTGSLRDSINIEVKKEGDYLVGFLGSDSDYAKIHEYGGTITASRAKYLWFKGDKGWAKVQQVTIPPRPFLRPAIMNNKDEIGRTLLKEGKKGIYGREIFR